MYSWKLLPQSQFLQSGWCVKTPLSERSGWQKPSKRLKQHEHCQGDQTGQKGELSLKVAQWRLVNTTIRNSHIETITLPGQILFFVYPKFPAVSHELHKSLTWYWEKKKEVYENGKTELEDRVGGIYNILWRYQTIIFVILKTVWLKNGCTHCRSALFLPITWILSRISDYNYEIESRLLRKQCHSSKRPTEGRTGSSKPNNERNTVNCYDNIKSW